MEELQRSFHQLTKENKLQWKRIDELEIQVDKLTEKLKQVLLYLSMDGGGTGL